MPRKTEVEFVENFLVVWDPTEGSKLYKMGFYGKPLGISKPKDTQFSVPLILDLMEGVYLAEKKTITVYEGAEKKKVNLRELRRRAGRLYEEFDEKYTVYHDLRNRGYVVIPGIKFGCDFAVYKHGPGLEHAPYMVSVRSGESYITAAQTVKAGRLATTVRKRFIIAVPNKERQEITYLIFKWFKA